MSRRLWVQILGPSTGWKKFSHIFVLKIVLFVCKDKNKQKEAVDGPLKIFYAKGGFVFTPPFKVVRNWSPKLSGPTSEPEAESPIRLSTRLAADK